MNYYWEETVSEIIAVVNQKGGTGKTTTAINLGSALSKLKKKILLVDLDSQANLSYSLGLNDPLYSISHVLEGIRPVEHILYEKEGMHIAPATTELADTEISLVDVPGRENFLANALQGLEKYDYIFIDAPPSLSVMTLNALNAADSLIVPLQMDVLSLRGLSQLLDTVEDFRKIFDKDLKIKGILAARYNKSTKLSQEVFDHIQENFSERIFKTVIRQNVRIAEAPSFGKSVLVYAPKSHGAIDYTKLAKELINIDNHNL